MIKNSSENKSDLTCEECGEHIKQNQIDKKPIYCEFCGALNSSVDAQNQEKSQLEQERIRFSYTTEELSQEIRNLTYQKIYELLKANFSIMRRLKHQEDLKQSQILKLAKKLRRALLSLSLPSDSAELLTKSSKKKIENYFEDFQVSLKKKKKNQSNYMPYLTKNIKFIYRLINGDYEFSTLTKYNQKAVKKLKIKYGFKINVKTKNSFSYSLSILLCRKIYRSITALGHVLDLKQSKNELTKQYTLNTAKDITVLVINNYFKRNLSKSYRRLKKDLEIDWVYRESFIEHVCSIIKLVYKLAYDNGYSSRLRGFQKLIAEDLKESKFFEDDTNFSPYLKLNLTLILSRIIHYLLDSSQNLTPIQSDPRKLNPNENLRLATEILDEILVEKKIKPEFLKKFYNLSLEEFQKDYKKLQTTLTSDMFYLENFLSYLQDIINTVYKITHTKTKKSSHSNIELVIIKDLANYNFKWKNRQTKPQDCFITSKNSDILIKDLKNTQTKLKINEKQFLMNKIENSHPSGSNLNEKERIRIKNFIIDLLGTDPIKNFEFIIYNDNYGSLRTMANRLSISRPTLRAHIGSYLEILYGKEDVESIIKLFWPKNFAKQKEKIEFFKKIKKYIRLYPERSFLIPTRNELLSSELYQLISKNTFKPWVIDYLQKIKGFTPNKSKCVYDDIWGKKCAKRRKIEYRDVEDFVHQRRARVITSKEDFNLMLEYPTDRYIEIKCKYFHKFEIQVKKLIYGYRWCPICNEHFCEKLMRNYMSQLFKNDFESQVNLNQACGINRKKIIEQTIELNDKKYIIPVHVGQLKFDCFCSDVQLLRNNRSYYKFAVAGEYDGAYHDEKDLEKNPFCEHMEDFAGVRARDSVKSKVSYNNKIILIRLKEKEGFNRKKLLYNQKEVLQEIARQFNDQVKKLFSFDDVRLKYNPNIIFDPLGRRKPRRVEGSIDKFLCI